MRRKFIVIFILLAIILIGGIYGWNEYNRTNKSLADQDADYVVNADQLITEFEQADSLASKKYLGKIISIPGTIKQVETDQSGNYTVVLGSSSSMTAVRCSMDSTTKSDVSNLKESTPVRIKGELTGFQKDETGLLGSDIKLNRCVVDKNVQD